MNLPLLLSTINNKIILYELPKDQNVVLDKNQVYDFGIGEHIYKTKYICNFSDTIENTDLLIGLVDEFVEYDYTYLKTNDDSWEQIKDEDNRVLYRKPAKVGYAHYGMPYDVISELKLENPYDSFITLLVNYKLPYYQTNYAIFKVLDSEDK